MPFINTKTNFEINKEKRDKIKESYGKAITLIPGKSERSLMLGFDCCPMYFGGQEREKLAFVEVKLFGMADRDKMNELTKKLCDILNSETGVEKSDIYVKFEEAEVWGCNGRNF